MTQEEFEKQKNKNVFLMMRYGDGHADNEDAARIADITNAIKNVLNRHEFNGNLASDHTFISELWAGIVHCIEYSEYGIAVCEKIPAFNANIAMELGYMKALKKDVLILKETGAQLPVDIGGFVCMDFSHETLKRDIEKSVTKWLSDRRLMTEIISGPTPIESKKTRTRRIIEALSDAEVGSIVRQAGIFSSLAITRKSIFADDDSQLIDLLVEEQRQMIAALERGVILRCVISPHVQKVAIELNPPEIIRSSALPRIEQLISVIGLKHPNLQIVYVAYPPYPNMLIVGDQLFIGRRRLHEWGFPSTTIIHDPKLVSEEIIQFDILFDDAAHAILGKQGDCAKEDYESEQLKDKVVRHLRKCYLDLEAWAADN